MSGTNAQELLNSRLGELRMMIDGVDLQTDSGAVVGMEGERRSVCVYEGKTVQMMLKLVDQSLSLAEALAPAAEKDTSQEQLTSHEIQDEMSRLAEQLEAREIADWCNFGTAVARHFRNKNQGGSIDEIANEAWNEVSDRVVEAVRSNSSRWSGGHSTRNLVEQINHDVAVALLNRDMRAGRKLDKAIRDAAAEESADA